MKARTEAHGAGARTADALGPCGRERASVSTFGQGGVEDGYYRGFVSGQW